MKLWLDDIRVAPWGYDLVAKNYDECIRLLSEYDIKHVSLDHDLSLEHYTANGTVSVIPRSSFKEKTGYDVLIWMATNNKWPQTIEIHTLNVVGRADMLDFLNHHAPDDIKFESKPYEPFISNRR